MTATCPWCSAPRDSGPACPRCGADYTKAKAIKAHGRAVPAGGQTTVVVETATATDLLDNEQALDEWKQVHDAELEYKFCLAAIPVTLCIAIAFHASGLGAALQRIFLTMPVHEFGHAVTAWFCGYAAIPTLWKTLVPETRGVVAPLALFGALGYMMFRARRANKPFLVYPAAALILLQAIATLGISPKTAHMWITFGGDGTGMILATLLMASFYFGKHTQLYKGSLRWGFVVIGAAAFVGMYATWWKSRSDESAIPYGTTGGIATDAMTLVDVHGWSLQTLVTRHVALGAGCLIVLALVYTWGVRRAMSEMEARQSRQKTADWEKRKRVGTPS